MAGGKKTGQQTGVGVDAGGWPVKDPTANVIAIVAAEVKRQDDLREQQKEHDQEIRELERQHAKELRIEESRRLDAIRSVSDAAVQRAAEVQAAQALTLSTTVATTAEAQRSSSSAQAAAITESFTRALQPHTEAIASLQRAQYELAARSAQQVETRTETRSDTSFSRDGVRYAIAVAGFVLALVIYLAK